MDETYVKVAGRWVYLYRAIDQYGQVIDVLVSEQRDLAAGIEQNVKELVRHVVEAVAREGREPVRCLLEGFADKSVTTLSPR